MHSATGKTSVDQVDLVRLGIFLIELEKRNILFGIGDGAEFRPQISVIKSPGIGLPI